MNKISSIKLAIENEATEMKYYLDQAARSKNSVAKLLFETLAYDEKEHMERIKTLHQKLVEVGTWPEEVSIEIYGTDIKQRIHDLIMQKETSVDHDDDDITALKKAAKGESEGAKFYKELADICSNKQEKEFFNFLSQIEYEHFLSIKDSIFYLEDPEGWFEQNGRASNDGA